MCSLSSNVLCHRIFSYTFISFYVEVEYPLYFLNLNTNILAKHRLFNHSQANVLFEALC
jgi:hypothetical protein